MVDYNLANQSGAQFRRIGRQPGYAHQVAVDHRQRGLQLLHSRSFAGAAEAEAMNRRSARFTGELLWFIEAKARMES